METTEILMIVLGLVVGVPILGFFIYRAIKSIINLYKAKQYPQLFALLLSNMEMAATNCATNEAKKELVMDLLDMNAKELGIVLTQDDKNRIADCVDAICSLAKVLRRGKEDKEK